MLFEQTGSRESMVSRAMTIRIGLGHHVSTSNPAVLLKDLLATKESRQMCVGYDGVRLSLGAARTRHGIV